MLLRVRELSGNTISITPRNIIQAGDSMVLALVHVTAARGDRTLDEIAAHLSRWENEQIVEYWTTYQDQDAVDDFWG